MHRFYVISLTLYFSDLFQILVTVFERTVSSRANSFFQGIVQLLSSCRVSRYTTASPRDSSDGIVWCDRGTGITSALWTISFCRFLINITHSVTINPLSFPVCAFGLLPLVTGLLLTEIFTESPTSAAGRGALSPDDDSSGVECCFHTQLKYLSFYSNMLQLSKSVCWIRTQLKSDSTFEILLKS